jgi:hypothetical protein
MSPASTSRAGRVALARLLRRIRTWVQRQRARRSAPLPPPVSARDYLDALVAQNLP